MQYPARLSSCTMRYPTSRDPMPMKKIGVSLPHQRQLELLGALEEVLDLAKHIVLALGDLGAEVNLGRGDARAQHGWLDEPSEGHGATAVLQFAAHLRIGEHQSAARSCKSLGE